MPENKLENALKNSNSIYLRRHGENPVPWQTWGEDAFRLAKELKRPVFLSSGYASCHWCRVMEQESFSDPETARILAEKFVPIKLDKDEYPDIDKKYQFYLQSTGEAGGWPLTVFMTPDKEPFFAGTYYPLKPSANKPSFKALLNGISKVYKETPEETEKVIKVREDFLKSFYEIKEPPVLTREEKEKYQTGEFKKIFDREFGGLREGAKFPNIPAMTYLAGHTGDPEILKFLILTADKLCTSAISDHLFGGFFRYTADRKWMRPHFEKMLTDNAQIPSFLLKMYDITENRTYLMTAKKALDYVINNLMTDFGLLNSVDADSPNAKGLLSEGYFYKVTDRDFTALTEGELKNFPNEAGVENGIIWLKSPEYIKVAAIQPTLEKVSRRAASVKTPPASDNKILSGPNFMFCSALLDCFETSGEDWYLDQASALFGKMRSVVMDGPSVYRGSYGGEIIEHKVLEDHVYCLETAVKFFDITKEKEFLSLARAVSSEIERIFVKDELPYLDSEKTILDSFDDDKPNPMGLYLYLRTVYENLFDSPSGDNFKAFARDRTMRFPTGHPTMMRAKL